MIIQALKLISKLYCNSSSVFVVLVIVSEFIRDGEVVR
jgi:hypothetical protein